MARAVTILALIGLLGLGDASGSLAAAQGVGDKGKNSKAAAAKHAAKSGSKADHALARAKKALDAGKADVAVDQMNALLGTGGLDSQTMARAMVLRGLAYKKQGKPAQAISDLQSALWLKGALSDKDRSQALHARVEAYREAGLGEPPPAPGQATKQTAHTVAAPVAAPAAPTAAARAPVRQATAAPQAAAPSSGGLGDFLSGIFGGQKVSQPTASLREAAPPSAPRPSVSSWSNTEVVPAKNKEPAAKAKTSSGKPGKTTTKSKSNSRHKPADATEKTGARAARGKHEARLAPVRSRAEAAALAARVKKEEGSLLGGHRLEINETTFGNMGKFYRVSIGPFASANETQKLCAALRGKGIDCMHTTE